jgi:hypothetical protein
LQIKFLKMLMKRLLVVDRQALFFGVVLVLGNEE